MFRHSEEKLTAQLTAWNAAVKRMNDRPDIHLVQDQKSTKGKKLEHSVTVAVLDLKFEVPDLEIKQIAKLIGISTDTVGKIIRSDAEEVDPCSPEANMAASAASLAALQLEHPEGPGADDPRAKTEFGNRGLMVVRSTPNLDPTASYRVDQSDSVPRPITLPSRPFAIAA